MLDLTRVEPNTWLLVLVAVMNAITMYYTRRTEKNTNSMKDALVQSTADASFSKGEKSGRLEGEVKAAALAEGKLQAIDKGETK